MYAIIKTGGKQYRIAPGDVLRVEHLPGERGDEVILDQVLMVTDGVAIQVGQPLVPNATVRTQIVRQGRAKRSWSSKRNGGKIIAASRATGSYSPPCRSMKLFYN